MGYRDKGGIDYVEVTRVRKLKDGSIKYVLKFHETPLLRAQIDYICGVSEWLHNSLRGKGKIVGGPTDDSDLEKKTYIGESLVA